MAQTRNIERLRYGFLVGAVNEFIDCADEWSTKPTNRLRGCVNTDYLLGKPIGKWISAVREILSLRQRNQD